MSPGTLLLAAASLLVAGALAAWRAPRLWLVATLAATLSGLAAALAILGAGGAWDWRSRFTLGGDVVHLHLDGLSAFFLALLALLAGAATLYSHGYWTSRAHPRSAPLGRAWWDLMLVSMGFVLLAANGLQFLIGWEIFTVSAYFLIALERQRHEARAAGWLYLAASHVSMVCLFAFFAALAARTGSWELGPLRERAELAPLYWLALVGFGIKAGMFPLHFWLPSAHANAPSHVSAMLSGVALKIGVYGLLRFSGWLPVPVAVAWVLTACGVVSAVLGVVFALGQHDLKRLLAYHSVENIGIILTGLGFALLAAHGGDPLWGRLALAGALLHVWNHGLFKALLFFGAGSVLHTTGTRVMSRLGGLWRNMPWTAACFVLGAAAISGLPPLNGFVSEWLVYVGLFDAVTLRGPSAWAAVPAVILLGVTGALALACFVKVCGIVFLGQPRTASAERAHECGWLMRVPMLVLAALCVMIGLAPQLFWRALVTASLAWRPEWTDLPVPSPLVTLGQANVALVALAALAAALLWRRVRHTGIARAPTWGCAYPAPNARMQYTAGSFAAIVTQWFGWVLQPVRHARAPEGPFPVRASHEEHARETVLELGIGPVARAVMAVAGVARRLQHGRLQAYILYLVAGLAALALLVFAGARP